MSHRLEIVAPIGRVGCVQRLLVRAGAGRGSAQALWLVIENVVAAALQLNGGAQAGGADSDDDAALAVDRQADGRRRESPRPRRAPAAGGAW